MSVTLSGMVTLVRLEQPPNAESPMGDAVGDRVIVSGSGVWILDERGLALVEQDPIHTAVQVVERIHRYRCQAPAVPKRTRANVGDAVGDRNAGQAAAGPNAPVPMLVTLLGIVTLVRLSHQRTTVPDAGDAVASSRWSGCCTRRTHRSDVGDAVRDRHVGQAVAAKNAESPMLVTLFAIVTLVRVNHS